MEHEQHPHDPSPNPDALYGAYTATFRFWLELYNDVQCWTDPLKHCAMRLAWQAYQDAQMQYLSAVQRDNSPKENPGKFCEAAELHEAPPTEGVRRCAVIDPTPGREEREVLERLPGKVFEQYIKCGRLGCRCMTSDFRHGPYSYRVWREGAVIHKVYVKQAEVARVRAACDRAHADKPPSFVWKGRDGGASAESVSHGKDD